MEDSLLQTAIDWAPVRSAFGAPLVDAEAVARRVDNIRILRINSDGPKLNSLRGQPGVERPSVFSAVRAFEDSGVEIRHVERVAVLGGNDSRFPPWYKSIGG